MHLEFKNNYRTTTGEVDFTLAAFVVEPAYNLDSVRKNVKQYIINKT